MVSINLGNFNDSSIRVNENDWREQEQELRKQMFSTSYRVPNLKPLTQIKACGEELACGHNCGGCKGERDHLPCLEASCRPSHKTTKTDACAICTSPLGDEPCIELECRHFLHANCIREQLRHRWSTQRITFNFMKCPSCLSEISGSDNVPEIRQELAAMRILKRNLSQQAMKELEFDERTEELKTCENPFSRYFGKPLEYALHRTEFYEC